MLEWVSLLCLPSWIWDCSLILSCLCIELISLYPRHPHSEIVNQKRHRLRRNDKTCDFIEAETHSLLAFIVVLSRLGDGVELRNRVFLRFLASPSIDEVSGFANSLPPTHQSTFLCSSVSLSLRTSPRNNSKVSPHRSTTAYFGKLFSNRLIMIDFVLMI